MTRADFAKWRSNVSLAVCVGLLSSLFYILIIPLLSSFDPRNINRDQYGLLEIQGFGIDSGSEGVLYVK